MLYFIYVFNLFAQRKRESFLLNLRPKFSLSIVGVRTDFQETLESKRLFVHSFVCLQVHHSFEHFISTLSLSPGFLLLFLLFLLSITLTWHALCLQGTQLTLLLSKLVHQRPPVRRGAKDEEDNNNNNNAALFTASTSKLTFRPQLNSNSCKLKSFSDLSSSPPTIAVCSTFSSPLRSHSNPKCFRIQIFKSLEREKCQSNQCKAHYLISWHFGTHFVFVLLSDQRWPDLKNSA